MDAVLRVDLQARPAVGAFQHLVDPGRAIALRRLGPLRQVDLDRHARILQPQMHRLIFLVVGLRERDVGQPVEGQHAVRLGVVDRLAVDGGLQAVGVGLLVAQRVAEADARQDGIHPHVEAAERDAERRAETRPQRLGVAHRPQILGDRP